MSSIMIFSGIFCHGDEVAGKIAGSLGFELISDEILTVEISKRFEIPEEKIQCVLSGETSLFNRFTHERERCISCIKAVLADRLKKDRLLFFGFAGHLIPNTISHLLKVGIIAEKKYRTQRAIRGKGLQEAEAARLIQKHDERARLWIKHLFDKDPWDTSLYDMIIPMHKKSVNDTANFILEYAKKDVLIATETSKKAVGDFDLTSRVEVALGKEGHNVAVGARDGQVTLTINKHVLMLSRLKEELKKITLRVPGVKEVETKVGPGYYKSNIYRQFDLKRPSKVLLVDDERDFVETLSDRLLMRDMSTAVVYNGEEGLTLMEQEEPEVMVLDLKMPGIDGIEVLRKVKNEHPNVEVIVLTGHGSKEDEEMCRRLGAFAYMEKPVDIEVLSQIMRKAYQKVKMGDSDREKAGGS